MDAPARSEGGLNWRGALQVCVALIGVAMFVCGAALSVLWGQPASEGSASATAGANANLEPAAEAPATTRPSFDSSPAPMSTGSSIVVFDEPRLVLQLHVRGGGGEDDVGALDRYLHAVQERIDRLGQLEIMFIAPDKYDRVGSLCFSDTRGQRWVMHLVDLGPDSASDSRICARVAERLNVDPNAPASSIEQFDDAWRQVQSAISLPMIDAAAEFQDEIVLVHPVDP